MADPDAPILDGGVLDELATSVGGDNGFVAELIATYLDDAPVHLADIAAAGDSGDAAALVRPAHTLKSSSATVGAMQLSARARSLEMAGRSGEIDGRQAAADLAAIGQDFAIAEAELRAWLEDHAG